MRLIIDMTSPPSVSKLKPTSPCYLPYLDAFPGVVVPRIDPARHADMCYGPSVISVTVTKGGHPRGDGLYGTSGTIRRGVSRVT